MRDIDKKKGELIQLFKEGSQKDSGSQNVTITGNGNQFAGRDMHNYINKRENVRYIVKPGPEHITPAQALKIQELVHKAASIEAAAGMDEGKARISWFSKVKSHFGVPTYREIPAHHGETAIKWLQQQIAMNRRKTRRTDNKFWRNENYAAIWARSKELGLSKADVYALAKERLGVQIISLKQLSDQNLKKLYGIIMGI